MSEEIKSGDFSKSAQVSQNTQYENQILQDSSTGNFNKKMSIVFSRRGFLSLMTLVLLVVGVGAATVATQRSTEYRQQASTPESENPYTVVPLIYLPADFNSSIETYTGNVKNNFVNVSQWYKDQIGKTFNPADPVVYQSTLSSSQIFAKYPDSKAGSANGYFVRYETPIALSAKGKDICDPMKIYYFVTPINVSWGGSGGREFFGCERFPGYASIPGHMGRLIGGIIDPGWPEWWAVEPRQARGGVAHELGHLFGAYCDTTGCNLTPHNSDPHSILYAWWDYENPENPAILDSESLGYINRSSQIIFFSPNSTTPTAPTSTPTIIVPSITPTPSSIPTLTPTPTHMPIPTLTITSGNHADINRDGTTDLIDFGLWLRAFRGDDHSPYRVGDKPYYPDIDGSGTPEILDFNIWLISFRNK